MIKLATVACVMQLPVVSAATIAGSDFSDAATFQDIGGAFSITTDDLDLTDGITVGAWTGSFQGQAINGLLSGGTVDETTGFTSGTNVADNVIKLDGAGNPTAVPTSIATAGSGVVSFSITIDAQTTLDLTSVTWDSRGSTGTAGRWVAFHTSLDTDADTGLLYSEGGSARPNVDNVLVNFSDPKYQGLTNTTVEFFFSAGGAGSGDSEFDNLIINGDVTAVAVPEPSAVALLGLGALGTLVRRRR